ncbi:MAG: hypothetical protein K1X88_35035 [Nannocystaceae bacterium]|nr:hypothetical protein [Nannocystaceae bacterium]
MAPRFAASVCLCATLSGCVTDESEPTLGSSDSSGGSAPTSASDTSAHDGSTGDDTSSSDDGHPSFDCPAPTDGPTMHPGENVEAAQVWTASGSPHLVPYDFTIHAPVLVEACARVQIGGGVTLTIGDGGSFVTDGFAEQPVVIERLDAEPWTTIRTLGGEVQLFYTTLDGGGAVGNGVPELTGALWLRAPSGTTAVTDVARLHEVEIRGSEAAGLRLDGFASIAADSQGLTITEGASHPISASATVVGAIPEGQYDGNADDRIVLTTANTETISVDAIIYDRGVPYIVGQPGQVGDLRVQANPGALAVLTIEAGVELQFQSEGILTVDHATGDAPATGALVAVGTAQRPIVFTSAAVAPAAGDWLGIYFGGTLDMLDELEHVRVEYAGGASASGSNSCMYPGEPINNAAIRIFGVPPGRFVKDSEIIASAAHGIDRGWRADLEVDFAESVTFEVTRCTQTTPRKADGTCPDRVPCP